MTSPNIASPPSRPPAIEVQGLSHFYEAEKFVIRDLSFRVRRGSVWAILGPNGCGKTTLLKLILGILKPRSGKIEKSGQTALVPQLFNAVFSFSVLDMVLMGRARQIGLFSRPTKKDQALALGALARFGVDGLAERPFTDLSGGQRQLVMLARAVVAEADILILDEPASALDLANQGMLLKQIRALSRESGLTVVFTSHQPQQALAAADEALMMSAHSQYFSGPVGETLSEENLFSVYGAVIRRLKIAHQGHEEEILAPIFFV
jgi:iron complex transport system ATP-binding protein